MLRVFPRFGLGAADADMTVNVTISRCIVEMLSCHVAHYSAEGGKLGFHLRLIEEGHVARSPKKCSDISYTIYPSMRVL